MQAPASDREYHEHHGAVDSAIWSAQLPVARTMVEQGRGEELLDRSFCEAVGTRLTAYRLHSLLAVG